MRSPVRLLACGLALVFLGLWPAMSEVPRGPGDDPNEMAKTPLRVLFLGNSMTYFNAMPQIVRHLAAAWGRSRFRFEPVLECPGGVISFQTHWDGGVDQPLIKQGPWDWVMLQENSSLPSYPVADLERQMYPYARKFNDAVRAAGSHTMFMMTWGFKDGNPDVPRDMYEAMQDRLQVGYETIARELHAAVAPAGLAWKVARRQKPSLNLYYDDHHPNEAGAYLVACVICDVLYPNSVAHNSYAAGLDSDTASFLQGVADQTCVTYPHTRGF